MGLPPEHFFPNETLKRIGGKYVPPDSTTIDPTAEGCTAVRAPLFEVVDQFLNGASSDGRLLLLLGDTGMGKTSFLLNYCLRNNQQFGSRRRRIAMITLGYPSVERAIKEVSSKRATDLFLDALDEDAIAVRNAPARMIELLKLSADFRTVLITCNTQFFNSDHEIRGFRSAKVGSDRGELMRIVYIAPFTHEQTRTYIKKRYGLFNLSKRRRAMELTAKISRLSVRPMLLDQLSELVVQDQKFERSFEIYGAMTEGWLVRESAGSNEENLRNFCEELAVDLVVRGTDRIPRAGLVGLADTWQIPLEDWQMRTRSLLNRDPEGNYKFAHRSILEYFFVKRMLEGDERCFDVRLTEQMKWFLTEMERLDLIQPLVQPRRDTPRELVKVVNSISTELLAYLKAHPNELYSLRPRQFEEIVAETLAAYGWEVHLTPPSKDGGYDLFAVSKDVAGVKTSWIIECKKYRRDRRVGIEIVRALYGVKHEIKAANAMLATTSFFTKGVHDYKASRYDLELKDYEGIVEWIRSYKLSPDGRLYLRDGGA